MPRGLGRCWLGMGRLETPTRSVAELCCAGRLGAAGTSGPYPSRPEHPALLPGPEPECVPDTSRGTTAGRGPGWSGFPGPRRPGVSRPVPLPTGPDLGVSWHRPTRAPLAGPRVPRAALYR